MPISKLDSSFFERKKISWVLGFLTDLNEVFSKQLCAFSNSNSLSLLLKLGNIVYRYFIFVKKFNHTTTDKKNAVSTFLHPERPGTIGSPTYSFSNDKVIFLKSEPRNFLLEKTF